MGLTDLTFNPQRDYVTRILLIFVITVLLIQLVTLFHAQNVAFTAKGRYQVNFRIDTKLLLVLSDFSKTQRYNLKKLAQLVQIAIHFHPGHPQLKTLNDSLDTLI